MPDDRHSDRSLSEWLLGDARSVEETTVLVAELGERLNAAGIDVRRITTGIPILHPQVASYSALWNRGSAVTERVYQLDSETMAALSDSPIAVVYGGGGPVRCDPGAPPSDGEFPVVADLRAEGFTDYVVMPARFSDRTTKAVSFATDRSGGFAEAEIAVLETLMPMLGMVLEIQALKRTARILLETYVGHETGRRVLQGAIRRGMGETIRAAIWLSDLRDFSVLSETLPRDEVIGLLNDYFGALSEAVTRHDGEILKFIGDAMLAIFPVASDGIATATCRAALAAAAESEALAAAINRGRSAAGRVTFRFGIALHVGDVMYGNIGGATRLDFTVIGPAVNLASRISGVCATLGRTVLVSEEFTAAAGGTFEHVGTFDLKGIAQAQPVYLPPPSG
jgi:adenylate cyclase